MYANIPYMDPMEMNQHHMIYVFSPGICCSLKFTTNTLHIDIYTGPNF